MTGLVCSLIPKIKTGAVYLTPNIAKVCIKDMIMWEILDIKTRREKKQFIKAVIGGTAVMACVYLAAWISYIFAPAYYGW